MKNIDYRNCYEEVIKELDSIEEIVLATSYQNRVTARIVNCIVDREYVYFITSKAYTKVKQIEKNPKVALTAGGIQIEGEAEILGHPNHDINSFIFPVIESKSSYKEYFKKYSKYKNSVLVKVKPRLVTLYKGAGAYNYLDLEKEEAYKKGRV